MKQIHDDWQVAGSQLNSKTPPQGAQTASQAIRLAAQHLDACASAGGEDPAVKRAGRSSRTRRLPRGKRCHRNPGVPIPAAQRAYLARYTHRVAISNSRLVRMDNETVTFTWKDYADQERLREMTLSGEEFLRRFLLHVLPDRFVRIRYYGLLANRHRQQALALCREVLPGPPARPQPPKTDWCERLQSLTGVDPRQCEVCGEKALRRVGKLSPVREPRAPPR